MMPPEAQRRGRGVARSNSDFDRCAISLSEGVDPGDGESRTLAALRDVLLPKLIAGELRVAAAERILGGQI